VKVDTKAPSPTQTTTQSDSSDKNQQNKPDELGALPPDLQEEGKGQARIGVTQYVSLKLFKLFEFGYFIFLFLSFCFHRYTMENIQKEIDSFQMMIYKLMKEVLKENGKKVVKKKKT